MRTASHTTIAFAGDSLNPARTRPVIIMAGPWSAQRLGERRASTTLNDGTALAARPFHLKFGVISAGLDRWRSATTRVPEGKHFNLLTADPVVKIVVNSRKMDAPHAPCLGVQCRGANSRL